MSGTVSLPGRYDEVAPGCSIDLSDNTNLWGPPPSVVRVMASGLTGSLARYPSAYSNDLKRAIAKYAEVEATMVATGCGSDDILDSALRAFGEPGGTVAMLDPTFSMMRSFASLSGLAIAPVRSDEPDIPLAFRSKAARITYLCSPNNPTGAALSAQVIESIVAHASGIVVIDEAYIDFGGVASIALLERYENVLITRTFSKAFGLAGFRVGYALGSSDVIHRVEAARGPYKVSALSERVAIDALTSDTSWVAERAAEVLGNRKRLALELSILGCPPLESSANFVLVPVRDAIRVEEGMRSRSVAVRAFTGLTGIGDAVRITVGPWDAMERCITALSEVLQ